MLSGRYYPYCIGRNCLASVVLLDQVYAEWVSKYGPVFGFFEGLHPMLYVSHPDALQQILQTDFSNFTNRPLRDDQFQGHRGDVFSTRG